MSEALDQKLSALKLARIRQVYPSWIEQAERLELGYGEVLEQLATEELLSRQENHLRRHLKAAGFPLHHGEVFYLRGSSYRMRGKEPVSLTSAKSEDSPSSAQR
jgi:hypothetical protein